MRETASDRSRKAQERQSAHDSKRREVSFAIGDAAGGQEAPEQYEELVSAMRVDLPAGTSLKLSPGNQEREGEKSADRTVLRGGRP